MRQTSKVKYRTVSTADCTALYMDYLPDVIVLWIMDRDVTVTVMVMTCLIEDVTLMLCLVFRKCSCHGL